MNPIIAYHDVTEALVAYLAMPRALIHMHAGMAIYLGCLMLMGTRRGSLMAVGLAVGLAVMHEVMNRLYYGTWRWHDTTADLLFTVFWPTMSYAVSYYRRWSWAERTRQKANDRLLHLYDYRPEQQTEC